MRRATGTAPNEPDDGHGTPVGPARDGHAAAVERVAPDGGSRALELAVDAALHAIATCLDESYWAGPIEAAQLWARRLLLAACCAPQPTTACWGELEARLDGELPSSLRAGLLQWRGHLPESLAELPAARLPPATAPGELYELLLTRRLVGPDQHPAGRWGWSTSGQRRQFGSHFTPTEIADLAAERCLEPLLAQMNPQRLDQLALCDPAAGAGALLAAAARRLARWLRQDATARGLSPPSEQEALQRIVTECIWGIDVDPTAVLLSAHTLWSLCGSPKHVDPGRNLIVGDAVRPPAPGVAALDPALAFPKAFDRPNPGFDAMLGNPPWVAYVGRASQPIEPWLKKELTNEFNSFRRYKTLHGVFVERCATWLRRGGRLGLILPTSVADLAGYAPTRRAHDQLCEVDAGLPDLGDGQFPGVFQPSMVLLSTRREVPVHTPGAAAWPLLRSDLDEAGRRLLERLDALPKCPPTLFGERGYQTAGADRKALEPVGDVIGDGRVALLSGSEVSEFRRAEPRWQVDPTRLNQRLRPNEQWQRVRVLIRQTARFPIAAPAAGHAFRNSLLAGFESDQTPWPLLLAYLNSALVRWFHYHLHRDARQGMPQLKVSHLRSLPLPPAPDDPSGTRLFELGRQLAQRNAGIDEAARSELDRAVFAAFELTAAETVQVRYWAEQNPPPTARRPPEANGD